MDPWQISSASLPSEDFLESLCSTLRDLGIDPRELQKISPTFLNFIFYLHEDIARLEEEVITTTDTARTLQEDCERLRRQRNELFKQLDQTAPDTPLRNDVISDTDLLHARAARRQQGRSRQQP
ncbi:MAG: hypothetical protein ACOCXA_05880 [Planctomycetota bacterium]